MMRFRRPLVIALVVLGAGCKTQSVDPYVYSEGPLRQKYELKEVKEQSKRLRPGMTRSDVVILLGSPAERQGDTWIYLHKDSGLVVPRELLEVYFERGRYKDHKFKMIVFGRRPTPE